MGSRKQSTRDQSVTLRLVSFVNFGFKLIYELVIYFPFFFTYIFNPNLETASNSRITARLDVFSRVTHYFLLIHESRITFSVGITNHDPKKKQITRHTGPSCDSRITDTFLTRHELAFASITSHT